MGMEKRSRRFLAVGVAVVVASLVVAACGGDGDQESTGSLSRGQAVPVPGPGSITGGEVEAEFDDDLTEVDVDLKVEGGENVVAAHFHCGRRGEAGPVAFGLFQPGPMSFDGEKAEGVLTNEHATGADYVPSVGRPVDTIAALASAMTDGLIYANVHTSDNPPGEVRAQLTEE